MSRLLRRAAFALLLALPTDSAGQTIGARIPTWVPNGPVNAVLLDGDVVYAGGAFDQVGPLSGAFAVVDKTDDTAFTTGASVTADVGLVVADGSGGWYVATIEFASGNPTLIHVRADGTRDPAWTPPTLDVGTVAAVAAAAGRVYVGGSFRIVNGVLRGGVAALDATTGAVLPWDAQLVAMNAPANVSALAATPTRVYVAGFFQTAAGASRNRFAILDAASGAVLPGALSASLADPQIANIEVTSARTYLYGGCRSGAWVVCAYDLDLNPLAGWTFPAPVSSTMAASDAALYVIEPVLTVGWLRVNRLDPATGSPLPWTPPEIRGNFPSLLTMQVDGNTLYVGGDFLNVNGQPRSRVAAVDATSGALTPWAPRIGGRVTAIAPTGPTVGVGGTFEVVGGVPRQNLVALDLRTGRPLNTTPPVAAWVKALLKIGDVVVVGGQRPFTAPATTPDVTAFLASTGAAIPWSLTSNGSVDTLAADSRRLYLGGRFSLLSGTPRLNLASIDLATAALSSWNPSPDGVVTRLALSSDALFAAGAFNSLIGYGRAGVAAFSTATGEVLPFNPGRAGLFEVKAFGIHRDRVLLAGTPLGAESGFRWVDRISGTPLALATPGAVAMQDGAQVGDSFYAVGFPTDASPRGLVFVDLPTGRASTFASDLLGSGVSVAASASYVVAGGGASFGTRPGGSIAVYAAPLAGAPRQMQSAVTGNTVTLGWQPGTGPATTAYLVEAGTTAGGTNVGVFNVGLSTRVAGGLAPGTYYIRVRGVGANGAGAASSEVIATVPPTSTPPGAPGTLSALVSAGVVTLSWGAAAGNATSYVIEAGTAAGLTNIGALPTGNLDTTWSVPAPAGTYFVRVRAANAFGLSAATNEVTVVVP